MRHGTYQGTADKIVERIESLEFLAESDQKASNIGYDAFNLRQYFPQIHPSCTPSFYKKQHLIGLACIL